MVDEVQNGLDVAERDPAEVEDEVASAPGAAAAAVSLEGALEPRRAGGEDDLVGVDLLVVVRGEGDVVEVVLEAQLVEGGGQVRRPVVPAEAKLFRGSHLGGFTALLLVFRHFSADDSVRGRLGSGSALGRGAGKR